MPPTLKDSKTPPKSQAIREPMYLQRKLTPFLRASEIRGDQWRALVGSAPIVRSCAQTLIQQICDIPWELVSEDTDAAEYFTHLIETSDEGEGFEVHLSRVIDDALLQPFGGAIEVGFFSDGTPAWQAHIDGGTMVPTYIPEWPFAQIDPWGNYLRPEVLFKEESIGRVRWQAQSSLKAYGWQRSPAMDALPAIQALVRSDRFWQNFLSDSPPAGLLDLMDMTEDEAVDWYQSWKTMMAGIDPQKVGILYGGGSDRKQPARFIEFSKSPSELSMMEVIKLYAQTVAACFGMTIGDIGLFDQELRLAGATKIIELSKRRGLAKLMRAYKTHMDNNVLPDDVEFQWKTIDHEDALRKATTANMRATSITTLAAGGNPIISREEARLAVVAYDIIPEDVYKKAAEIESMMTGTVTDEGDAELDTPPPGDNEPSGTAPAEEQRAAPPVVDKNSKAAKRMKKLAERLLAPSLKGATPSRINRLIDIGVTAWGGQESRSLLTRAGAGMIVALVPSADVAAQLAIEGGETPDDMHITIAYLDEGTDVADVEKAVLAFAAISPPLDGDASGVGRFNGPEGEDAVYASVDIPALPAWRQRLVEMLEAAGLSVNTAHGFSPHITLAFVDSASTDPLPAVATTPLTFDSVAIWNGDDRREFPLNPDAQPMIVARSLALQVRSRDEARAALERAIASESWWESPSLVKEVSEVLRMAFSEGIIKSIDDLEGAREALGLPAASITTTTINVTNRAVLAALKTRGGDFITGINDGTRRYIVDNIMRGVEQARSSPDIAKSILADQVQAGIIDRWKNRTNSIVNYEISWAESFAAVEQQAQIGLTKKRWIDVPGLACPICESNAALGAVDLDYEYDTAVGPSQHTPGHPGVCHCYMGYDEGELKKLGDDPNYWLGK